MLVTRLGKITVLAVAAGGPYIASETDWGRNAAGSVTNVFRADGTEVAGWGSGEAPLGGVTHDPESDRYPVHSHHQVETLRGVSSKRYRYEPEIAQKLGAMPASDQAPGLAGNNVADLREVLRFDLTTHAVLNRFSRVSTVLADLQLEGLRVPIVTGTQATDLAGTLTYYFDRTGQIQRISLHGFTGDPSRLVTTLQSYYGLVREPALEAGVFTKRWNGTPVHFLRLTHAPVVFSDAVHQKYTVFLELNQPNLTYGISDEAKRIVVTDQWTGRW
ncbi:hypothetical protein LOC71_12225 [Rhodopirellula sp. JC740]|uniref:DUF6690 domain-containing protein n=1 Tax=Rhodopirellula halodulae TaxID=2894198 RepID=A0ABS8NI16_9BACT|nr:MULTISPECIES: DUF6690 family protein [unclassified Rhodopirellula]MCC9643044.1 hypothetical protein [Rhodopirellula sp. JC740]MCC9655341.1 hypothetical protein [Rhodopirellula sp. JC737]